MGAIERVRQVEYKKPSEALCRKIASEISSDLSPKRIEEVINISNLHGHITHGVKVSESIKNVKSEGVMPLTPEGGFVSCWTSGTRIFASSNRETPLQFFDTTFFHYAPSVDKSRRLSRMTIAVTNTKLLNREDISVGNNQVDLNIPVPREQMALLIVEGKRGSNVKDSMFNLLEFTLKKGYSGGEFKLLKI